MKRPRKAMRPRPIHAKDQKHQEDFFHYNIGRLEINYQKQLLLNLCSRFFSQKIFPHNHSHSWQPESQGHQRLQVRTSGDHRCPEASQHSPRKRCLGKIEDGKITEVKMLISPYRLMIHIFFQCSLKNSLYLEMTPHLLAGRVSSLSRCLKKSWRSHCH